MEPLPAYGEAACDEVPLGSYGLTAVLLKNIELRCENCTEEDRAVARLYANDQLRRVYKPEVKRQLIEDLRL